MMAPSGHNNAGQSAAGSAAVAESQSWQCGQCGQLFPNLIAAIAHVEVKHPSRARGRGGLA